MRTAVRLLLLILTTVLSAAVLSAPASAATAPSCGITWGSLDKSAGPPDPTSAQATGVRAGQHDCYDRLVVDLDNAAGWASYRVGYGTVRGVASGEPVPLAGGAALQITLRAHGESLPGSVPVSGFRTFRQLVSAGSFEGTTVLGLGVRARLPFRAFTVSGPAPGQTRLVVDVAHQW